MKSVSIFIVAILLLSTTACSFSNTNGLQEQQSEHTAVNEADVPKSDSDLKNLTPAEASAKSSEQAQDSISANQYLAQSEHWQQFELYQSETALNALYQWPDFIAYHFDGSIMGGKVGESIENSTSTVALVTVEKQSGNIGIVITESDGTTIRASLSDLESGQYEVQVDPPLQTSHLQFFFQPESFVGNILVEKVESTTPQPTTVSAVGPISTQELKAAKYDDVEAIAGDDYGIEVESGMKSDTTNNDTTFSLSANGITGCNTLFSFDLVSDSIVSVDYSATVTTGRFKLVYVAPDSSVVTLAEQTVNDGSMIAYSEDMVIAAGGGALKIVADNAHVTMELSISGEPSVLQGIHVGAV